VSRYFAAHLSFFQMQTTPDTKPPKVLTWGNQVFDQGANLVVLAFALAFAIIGPIWLGKEGGIQLCLPIGAAMLLVFFLWPFFMKEKRDARAKSRAEYEAWETAQLAKKVADRGAAH
jgi:hypothetical protein